jgi:glutathione synthase/RimK-type ligase-like ATP-grasp enzyme
MSSVPPVLLVTGAVLPEPDTESAAVIDALTRNGVGAALVSWTDQSIDWAAADLVVIRSTWDYPEHLDRFLGWCDEVDAVTGLWNQPVIVEWNSHKGYLLDLAAAGVPVIPTGVCGEDAGVVVADAASEVGWEEVVLKPAVGLGGFGVERFRVDDDRAQHHLELLVELGDAVMQPLAPVGADGTWSEISLVWMGGQYSHAVAKTTPVGEFRAQTHLGAEIEVHDPTAVQLHTAQSALDAVAADLLYARVDLVDFDGLPTVMELELIEPSLFLEVSDTVERFADVLSALVD